MALAQHGDGRGRCSIAGHDDGFDATVVEVIGHRERTRDNGVARLFAVGHVGGIRHIDEMFCRQGGAHRLPHAEAAQARVVQAYRLLRHRNGHLNVHLNAQILTQHIRLGCDFG